VIAPRASVEVFEDVTDGVEARGDDRPVDLGERDAKHRGKRGYLVFAEERLTWRRQSRPGDIVRE
jgi:hypothetical protein